MTLVYTGILTPYGPNLDATHDILSFFLEENQQHLGYPYCCVLAFQRAMEFQVSVPHKAHLRAHQQHMDGIFMPLTVLCHIFKYRTSKVLDGLFFVFKQFHEGWNYGPQRPATLIYTRILTTYSWNLDATHDILSFFVVENKQCLGSPCYGVQAF